MLKFRSFLLLSFLALLGCRTNPACERQVGLMRAELIALEDRYYELESKYRAAVGNDHFTIEHCPEGGDTSECRSTPTDASPVPPADSNIRILVDPRDSSRSEPNRASPIANSIGPEPELSVVTFQTPARFGGPAGKLQNPAPQPISGSSDQSANHAPLIVDPFNLCGRDDDGQPGDEGISFSLQVPEGGLNAPGELSIAVIDPKESGERQRIGLWKFSKDELVARTMTEEAANSATILLALTWNQHAPRHADVMLFVRWQAAGQAPLERSQSFRVNPVAGTEDLPLVSESQTPITPKTAEQSSTESAPLTNLDESSNEPEWQPDR